MEMKFGGLGIGTIVILWVIINLFNLGAKIVVNKYQPKGITEIVNAM
jgi:hypothetical protein